MKGGFNSGHDMWEDHKSMYGVITARIMCIRYLDMQARSKDPEERAFCAELREAMTMERNLAGTPVYLESWETAQRNDEEELFRDSDFANTWCAGEIDDAINACRYGDGSYKMGPAVQAMIEHCGSERLGFVLAVDVLRSFDSFSEVNRDWAQGYTLVSGFAGNGIRTHSGALDEFITCFRETIDRTLVVEAPVLNESELNFKAWQAVTESSRFKWVEDEIVRLNGRGAMYYTGGEDGIYMRIHKDGKLEAGNYEGAIPHIGEAGFTPLVTKQFDTFNDAYTRAMEAGGKQFLVDMFSGQEPQPLFQTVRGAAEEKQSVLKAIRDAQNAPKPPRKDKSPEQRKNKTDPDL